MQPPRAAQEQSGSPDTFARDLASSDPDRIRAAIRAAMDLLRTGRVDDPLALAESITPLAAHSSHSVRQSVAQACEHLPDPLGEQALSALREDSDAYVKNAAKRASDRRAARRVSRARDDAHDRVESDLLAELATKHSKSARKLAERAMRRREELLFRELHHETSKIVTPLQFSLQRARAENEKQSPDRTAIARDIDEATRRLDLLWAIVQSGRAYTNTREPELRAESLYALVDEARGHLLDRLGPRAPKLLFINDVDPALTADTDRSGILQVLQNILQNGAEAHPDAAPRIEIRASAKPLRGGSQIALSITDRGAGMSEEQKQELFIPFRSTKPNGTGLGLVIARRVIEEIHGGTLAVESTRGEGTTVKMTLPTKQRGAKTR